MKKFLLVVFIGMVLVINMYGIINALQVEEIEIDHVSATTETVYME